MTQQFDLDEWTRGFEERIAVMRRRAEEASAALTEGESTHTTRDGSVTVTVGPSGALVDVRFGARAEGMSAPQLSTAIMAAYREAATASARRLQETMSGIVGADSQIMDVFKTHVPVPGEEDNR
ncbi:hypothetical protein Afil01_15990 [Actinorhabdospora filicis]|uniref:YbaB/EbfC DNA-binding family protein n=1 Tax=Actinorhabdospora filicis TaxID=1785913 RepID=A0A9W6W2A3_9ACTN|nr:YbaB/EbfC family nucleoid-associated protein [Actinorhabdospora filicis]GLZ76792.1 hypothetical protein Afil01_15990 [Actinorhabdospora filicis]